MHNQQVSRTLSFYAKQLLIFSIILIFAGVVLEFTSRNKLIDPLLITPSDQKNDSVSVTPVTGNEVVSNENGEETSETQKAVSPAKTIEEINDMLRDEIQKIYGVSVLYGKQTNGYVVYFENERIKTSSITDSNVINNQLNKLKYVLSLYPEGLFQEIRDGGIPLIIYLINSYSDMNITGITDSSYNHASISIAAVHSFEESFYHESYHYIERYMLKKGANFSSWSILNPKGFRYGTVRNDFSYSSTFSENAPFVNNYAQTAAGEDRASTFEYMMASTKASCLNEKKAIWYKAKYMALMIETVFDSVEPDTIEYWERYL